MYGSRVRKKLNARIVSVLMVNAKIRIMIQIVSTTELPKLYFLGDARQGKSGRERENWRTGRYEARKN